MRNLETIPKIFVRTLQKFFQTLRKFVFERSETKRICWKCFKKVHHILEKGFEGGAVVISTKISFAWVANIEQPQSTKNKSTIVIATRRHFRYVTWFGWCESHESCVLVFTLLLHCLQTWQRSVLPLKIDGKPDMRSSPPCRNRILDANGPSATTADPCLVRNSVAEDKGNDCSDVC